MLSVVSQTDSMILADSRRVYFTHTHTHTRFSKWHFIHEQFTFL